MSSAINWSVPIGSPILQSPLYVKYASTTIGNLNATTIKNDIKAALASNESMDAIAYLVTLLRIVDLVA